MKRIHVRKCIQAEFEKYQFKEKIGFKKNLEKDIDAVADQLVYEPEGLSKFASSGCKRIPNMVRNIIVENKYVLKQEL
jgi:hypothetical protein